jgi:hypothetical protein
MNIITQDIAEVVIAVDALLKDSQDVHDIGANVELAEQINEDPTRCPWVGVYPVRCQFPSRALGMGGGYRAQNPEFFVVCQQQNALDGRSCLASLGQLVKAVTSAILSDPSLKGTVQMLGDFDVEFSGYQQVNDAIMQTATIRVVGLTTVSGG